MENRLSALNIGIHFESSNNVGNIIDKTGRQNKFKDVGTKIGALYSTELITACHELKIDPKDLVGEELTLTIKFDVATRKEIAKALVEKAIGVISKGEGESQ